jgi:glucose uptake protein GlcU
MFVLITLLIAGGSTAFAVHQWWHGHHMIAIAFIAVAWLVAGVAIEAAKNNQKAEATEHIDEVLHQR